MAKKRRLIRASVLVAACFSILEGRALAENEQARLEQLKRQIKQVDEDVHRLQQEKRRLSEQLKGIETQYGQVSKSIKRLQADAARLRHALTTISEKIAKTREAIANHKNELESQVRSAHAMGERERLKVIFNQQDPALSSRMLVYYDYLNKARLKKIRLVENKVRALQQLEQEKQKETGLLTVALQQRQREQIELQKVRKERESLVQQLDGLYSSKKSQLARLQEDERKLRQLIAELQKNRDDFPFQEGPDKPFAQLKGQLPWPVHGRLLKKFGSPRSESRWDGVLINAKEGTEIHAVTRGRVVYADWLRGYGLLTIIDHGKGYMTLYAFNQSLYKTEGDWVEAGEVIASVGNSGGRSQASLYFGIRKKGKPENPLKWCRKVRNGRVG